MNVLGGLGDDVERYASTSLNERQVIDLIGCINQAVSGSQ